MRLLLDTHIALWAITDSPRLSDAARSVIMARQNEVWISAASIWEISIKHALDRGGMPVSGTEALHWFVISGYQELPITATHAAAVDTLPAIHRDPFDRILIAQAQTEPLRLVTHDKVVAEYSNVVMLV